MLKFTILLLETKFFVLREQDYVTSVAVLDKKKQI